MNVIVNRCGIYKIRFRVHQNLQRYFNKKEINKSLDTRDISEAKAKANIIRRKYEEILKVCQVLEKQYIQELVNKYITEILEQDLIDRAWCGQGTVFCSIDYNDHHRNTPALANADMCSMLKADYMEDLSDNNYKLMENTIDQLLEKNTVSLDKNSDDYKILSYYMMLAQIQILEEASRRGRGTSPIKPDVIANKLFGIRKQKDAQIQIRKTEQTSISNKEALDRYIKYYKFKCEEDSISQSQYNDVTNFLQDIFLTIVYPNEDVTKTTLEDIIEIREVLKAFPKRNIEKYRKMSVNELLESNAKESELISSRTLSKYIKWIKSFYTYCHNQEIIQTNPLQLVTTTKGTNALDERLPLEHDEIAKLLELTKDDAVTHNLIKVFYTSGMRLSELYKCKIKEIDGLMVYDLTDKTLKLKTRSSYRIIPIHSSINIDLLKELPSQDSFSKKVNDLIRANISDDKKKVLYSLRHNFASVLKNNEVEHTIISELMGHSHQTMTLQRYASRYDVKILKNAIELITL